MQFDESKHPRDNDGKFTDGNGTTKKAYDSRDKFDNMLRNMPQGARAAIDKSIADLEKEQRREVKAERVVEVDAATSKPKRPEVEEAYGFANKERQTTHNHVSHAKEMGFKNQRDYERAAVDFFNSSRGKLYYSELRERYYRYDEKTGEMVVLSNGVIHTYMLTKAKNFSKIIKQDKLYEN